MILSSALLPSVFGQSSDIDINTDGQTMINNFLLENIAELEEKILFYENIRNDYEIGSEDYDNVTGLISDIQITIDDINSQIDLALENQENVLSGELVLDEPIESEPLQLGIFQNYTNIQADSGEFKLWSHSPYIEDNGSWIPYRLTNNDQIVQIETFDGKLVFDKNTGGLTIFDIDDNIKIGSDSYVVKSATVNTDIWNNLDVNDFPVSVNVREETTNPDQIPNPLVIVDIIRENSNEGIYRIEYIVDFGGFIKTTAYFENLALENQKISFTQTVKVPNEIELNDQTIIIDDYVGQTFSREVLEQYEDIVLESKEFLYHAGLGFDQLWSVSIHEDNWLSLDYGRQTEDIIAIGSTVELDPTITYADSSNRYYVTQQNTITNITPIANAVVSDWYYVDTGGGGFHVHGHAGLAYAVIHHSFWGQGDNSYCYDPSPTGKQTAYSGQSYQANNWYWTGVACQSGDGSGYTSRTNTSPTNYDTYCQDSPASSNACINYPNNDGAEFGGHRGTKSGFTSQNAFGSNGATGTMPSAYQDGINKVLADGNIRVLHGASSGGGSDWQNSVGKLAFGATYTLATVSTAPQSLTLDTQDVANEITLNWSAPSSNGGVSISNYKIYLGGSLIDTIGNVLTYDDTISGGEIGSSLTYKVVAVNGVGDSPDSNTATITSWNVPSQVTGLSVTSGTNPSMTWNAPSSDDTLTNYKIYRDSSLHDTISSSGTSYTDSTSLSSGTTYSYQIAGVSAVGTGTLSSSVNGVAGVPADPPTNVQAVISDPNSAPLAVTITYTNPTNVGTGTLTGFQLLRNGTAVSTVGLTNSISDTAPSGGNVFTYTVKSLSSHGTGTASSGSSVTTPNSPDQVTGLTVTPVSTSRIDLSWNTPSDNNSQLSGYKVQISSNGGSSYSDVLTGNVNTVYQALSLNGNAQYHFKVSAINAVGTGTASDVKNTYTMTTTPASLSATSVSQVQINLAWGNSTGATGYKIEYESPVDNGFTTLVNNTGNTDLTRSITSLTTGTQYNFKVSGWNNGGTSVASPEASAYTWGILQAPVIDTITRLSPTSLKVDWTTGTGLPVATGYKIERQLGTGWTILANNTGTTDVTYTDSTLSSDQSATYRLYAINTIGTSSVSNEKSSDAIASSGGGGGSSSSNAVSSQTGVSGLVDLTYIDQIHRVVLGQLLSKSINVAWDSSDNLEVKSIIVSDSPFRIVFQDVPFVLLGDPSGISNGKINYSVQIPNELCTAQGQINCVEQRQYDIPVEIKTDYKGSTLTKSSVIKIDLAGGSDVPLVFVLLAIGAVPLAFIIRKVGSGKSRRKASGSSHKSSKNGSNSKKMSM